MKMLINNENIADQMIVARDLLKAEIAERQLSNQYQNALIKNFSSHPLLSNFLSKNVGSLDIQWVGLKQRESVAIHEHAVDTMMVACKGNCRLTGEIESIFSEGDAIIVPKYVKHGLTQDNDELFWGLAFRFHS